MDSLFGRKRWGRQNEDRSAARRTVDLSDEAPGAFAMSAPTITPVRSGSISSGHSRVSTDTQRRGTGAASPAPTLQVPIVRHPMDPDISALRQSLLSRMHELRTNRPPDAEVELMFCLLYTSDAADE